MAKEDNQKKNFVEADVAARERRFQEQCFLATFLPYFASYNRSFAYPFLTTLQTSKSVSTIKNRLFLRNLEPLFQLTAAQKAHLVPHFELYKVVKNRRREELLLSLPFDDFTKPEDISLITSSRARRGSGVGLRSFIWKDLGQTPATAGKTMSATLTLRFNTTDDLYKIRDRKGAFISSFADLFRQPPTAKVGQTTEENEFETSQRNPQAYQIKAKVGWSVAPGASRSIITPQLRDALQATYRVLNLSYTRNNIEFKENGVIEATIDYVAAFDALMTSREADILLINNSLEKLLIQEFEQTIEANEEKVQEIEEKNNLEDVKTEDIKRGFFTPLDLDRLNVARKRDRLVEANKTLKQELKQTLEVEVQARAYSRLLEALEENRRVFYLDLNKNERRGFLGIFDSTTQLSREVVAAAREQGLDPKDVARQRVVEKIFKPSIAYDDQALQNFRDNVAATVTAKEGEEPPPAANVNETAQTGATPDSYRVYYFFLGDLLNAAMSVFYRENEDGDTTLDAGFRNNYRLLLAPIEVYSPATDSSFNIGLADIPVSLNIFQEWWIKKVVRKDLKFYPLHRFIVDVVSDLIPALLDPECFVVNEEGINKGLNNKIVFDSFSVRDDNNVFAIGKRVDLDLIEPNVFSTFLDPSKTKEFLYIGQESAPDQELVGNLKDDNSLGVYHFYIGAERGLLKNISFSRNEISNLTEANATSAGTNSDEAFAFFPEPYNVSLSLIGNAIFKNGMSFYVDPRSVGTPISELDPKNYAVAQSIPIGGYYVVRTTENRIEPGKFETKVEGIFSSWSPVNSPLREMGLPIQQEQVEPVSPAKRYDDNYWAVSEQDEFGGRFGLYGNTKNNRL